MNNQERATAALNEVIDADKILIGARELVAAIETFTADGGGLTDNAFYALSKVIEQAQAHTDEAMTLLNDYERDE